MKNVLYNKIFSKIKHSDSLEKNIKLLSLENEMLKNNNLKLKKENNINKDIKKILKKQNKDLVEENNHLLSLVDQNKNDKLLLIYQNECLVKQNEDLVEQNTQIKEKNKTLNKLNSFINFQEFLANSYVSPIVNAPFSSEDKRVFAFMDHITKYLIQNAKSITDKPLVSIIMPTYNREDIIQNAINSVLKQTYENWELIIIDDGSTDNTLSVLNKLPKDKIRILSYEENKGHSFARNFGLKISRGEYIMYLDSDNEWDSKYIETIIGAFMELPDADAIYSGQLLYKDFNSKPYAIRFGSFNRPLLHNRNYIDMNCFCHKRYIYEEIGGFDENLIKLVDWDYILRISNKFKMYSVPVLLSKYYESSSLNRVTSIPFNYYENASKILKKNTIPNKEYKNLTHKVSIIIPSYESLKELKLCIETILSFNLKDMIDIIIIDNDSSNEIKSYLKSIESKQIKIILNDINYGFTYAVKQGIDLSDITSDILLLNNDAILTEGAIEHMQMAAYSYNDCGIIVPHEIVPKENKHMNFHVPYANPKFECDVLPSKGHHNIINMPMFHDGGVLELNFAPFFCAYIKREVYSRTLGLDPELGRHYRSDRIFSDFIRHVLKMKIYQEPNAYVHHKHQTSTNILRKNENEFRIMFKENQWPSDLAKKLGFKKALWD